MGQYVFGIYMDYVWQVKIKCWQFQDPNMQYYYQIIDILHVQDLVQILKVKKKKRRSRKDYLKIQNQTKIQKKKNSCGFMDFGGCCYIEWNTSRLDQFIVPYQDFRKQFLPHACI